MEVRAMAYAVAFKDGRFFEGRIGPRLQIKHEQQQAKNPRGNIEASYRLTWEAVVADGHYGGSYDEFLDEVEAIGAEATEVGPTGPTSSAG